MMAQPGRQRQTVADKLSSEGIDPARIEFVPRQTRPDYLRTYHRIDLGLDSFPVNGHTTSLDAMWMSVPVVTLVGSTPMGRAGWCQLSNLGLTELAATSLAEYVQIAVELARDLDRLQEYRSTIRRRMMGSPLMNARRFAGNMEAAYRRIWREWCGKGEAKLQPLS
jgi:predicted O-linked N-acetylglucosamine transferase (SPINDLY family)